MNSRIRALLTAAATAAVLGAVLPSSTVSAAGVPLQDAIAAMRVEAEVRDGYDRKREFGDWIDADRDGCNTRAEVLLEEAVDEPTRTGRCTLSGGRWYSYYDNKYVTLPDDIIDIDHMVPLAEAWDSGARNWDKAKRVAYANHLDDPVHLVAVTGRSNRQKADKDPFEWMPYEQARCRYITEWVHIKRAWDLSVDERERNVLVDYAAKCPNVPISTTTADRRTL
ncbi:HNH endonuclease family protein [Streptomyces coeruleoprunus]|uniref:HNH endonuclease family protein n=1 Tax=Streptomyces coeruleoprunus TaxID=285563 RepID=A0ABV9XGU6_9ACTN